MWKEKHHVGTSDFDTQMSGIKFCKGDANFMKYWVVYRTSGVIFFIDYYTAPRDT